MVSGQRHSPRGDGTATSSEADRIMDFARQSNRTDLGRSVRLLVNVASAAQHLRAEGHTTREGIIRLAAEAGMVVAFGDDEERHRRYSNLSLKISDTIVLFKEDKELAIAACKAYIDSSAGHTQSKELRASDVKAMQEIILAVKGRRKTAPVSRRGSGVQLSLGEESALALLTEKDITKLTPDELKQARRNFAASKRRYPHLRSERFVASDFSVGLGVRASQRLRMPQKEAEDLLCSLERKGLATLEYGQGFVVKGRLTPEGEAIVKEIAVSSR